MVRLLIFAALLSGCAHGNWLTDPAHYGTKFMRDDWAKAAVDGSLECRELLAIGPKAGCLFDKKTNDCTCMWHDMVATEWGWQDVTRSIRFNACGILHRRGDL